MQNKTEISASTSARVLAEKQPRDKCGVFAVYTYRGPDNAALLTYLGLQALQHRGQESAGMAFIDGDEIKHFKGMGLVDHVFPREMLLLNKSKAVLGHVRYSTTGPSLSVNAQPLVARSKDKTGIALAHNGNLTNTRHLHNKLLREGHIFHTTSDTEIMLSYLFRYKTYGLKEAVKKTMSVIQGAYAAVVMDGEKMVAFRDPNGFRPLTIGRIGNSYFFASESSAFDAAGAAFVREVEPGEIVTAGPGGLVSDYSELEANPTLCIFEYIYFSRPDTILDGKSIYEVRRKVGSLMAERISLNLDMVIPSPDSGITSAIGLADRLNVSLEWAVHRNPYLGRTFIEPTQNDRELAVRLKFNPIRELVRGKKVAVVDDSLVRGTTARVVVSLLKKAGAGEVHLCIASPPYKHPCYYGIDIPLAGDLAMPGSGLEELVASLGANSITFAELDDLYQAVDSKQKGLCSACFSGIYPELGKHKGKVS